MARPKKPSIELKSIDNCTAAMGGLLLATTDVEALTAERDLAVAAASAKFEKILDDARGRKSDLEEALKAYYYAHLTEIEKDGAKHVQLANGVMGRRDNPPKLAQLNRNWSWAAIKAAVREKFGSKYFHEPKEPDLDKDKIKAQLAIEELKALGLKLDADETFYAEPARLPAPGDAK